MNPANFPFYTTTNSSTVCNSQPNTCSYKCVLIRNTKVGNHALPNLFLPSTPTRVESAAKSPALFLLQDPDRCLALGQPRAEGPGLPAFTTVVKPRPSGQYMAILSEAAHLGPPPSSDPEEAPLPHTPFRPSSGPTTAASRQGWEAGSLGSPGAHRAPAHVHFLVVELGVGGGLVPCSICSVKFVKCKESLNSCIFKREDLI